MIAFSLPWAFLLLPLPLAVWLWAPPLPARGALAPPDSVRAALHTLAGPARRLRAGPPAGLLLRGVGWLGLILALAGPHVKETPLTTPTGRDLIVALDLSASMGQADIPGAPAGRARIDLARAALGDFIRGRAGDRIAVIGFGTEAFLIAPFTFDAAAAAAIMNEMTIGLPGRRTDLGQAIGLAVRLSRPEPAAERMLVMVSDGETNAGALAARDAAALAAEIGLKVHAVGFAGEIAAESAAHMRELAEMTGGGFHPAASAAALVEIAAALSPVASAPPVMARRDWAWPFILLALVAAAGVGWREWRR